MSDLFEMLEEDTEDCKLKIPTNKDVENEIILLCKDAGFNIPENIAKDLADIYLSPPPWFPWSYE